MESGPDQDPAAGQSAPPPAPPAAAWPLPWRVTLLAVLFFCSGATGLVYEVAWSKRLELTFGSTSHSIGTVLAAYMAGLGLGAWWLGRWADRPGSPARRYALLEAGIGVWALVAPTALDLVEATFVALGGAGGLPVKALLGLCAILPATLLMGGTLPVLARSLVGRGEETQRAVGLLYGINTLGAVLGALLAGLLLMERFGLDAASRGTGLVNLALAACALAAGSRLAPPVVPQELSPPPPPPDSAEARARRGQLALLATFGCGLVALTLEVAWTRALGLALGSTGHGFTIMLAATLLGIGGGSLLAARVSRDERAPLGGLVAALLLLAGATYAFLCGYEALPRLFFNVTQSRALYYEQLLGLMFAVATLALLPATIGLGLAFPLCAQLGAPAAREAAERVGRLYLANTGGAILGSLLGAFAFVPLLGTEGVIRAGALLAGAGAAWIALEARALAGWTPERARALAGLGGAIGLAALVRPAWDPAALDLGPTRLRGDPLPTQPGGYEHVYRRGGSQLLFAADGLNAYVSVRGTGRSTSLLLGGKADASTLSDMSTQLLCGTLPFLARPDARQVLVIGCGSGVTTRVASDFPQVERVDLVEIEPMVVEAARRHFQSVNDGALDRPQVHLVVDDARTHLLTTDRRYELILAEPTNPSIAGVANLFSIEHYTRAQRVLAPGGVFLQWVQLYESDEWMSRAMLRTFCQAFPHVDLFWANPSDLLLLGSDQPLRYDPALVRQVVQANPGLTRDLWPRLYARAPEELLGRYVLPGERLRPLVADGEVLTDRAPRLEARAARARYTSRAAQALLQTVWRAHLAGAFHAPPGLTAPLDPEPLRIAMARELVDKDLGAYARAILSGSTHPEAQALLAWSEPANPQRRAALEAALAQHPDTPALLEALAWQDAQLDDPAAERRRLAQLSVLPGPRGPAYWLLRLRQLDLTRPDHAAEGVHLAEQGLATLLPRERDMELRHRLLGELARCAARAPRAVEVLTTLMQERRQADEEVGMALVQALIAAGSPEEALTALDRLDETCALGYALPARLLRLSAWTRVPGEAARLGLEQELQRFLRDFPDEVDRPEVIEIWQSLQDLRVARVADR